MKKLFSIVLMGAALFVSTNANAVVVNDEDALRDAIAAGATIQLGGASEIFTIAAPLDIEIDGAMILDLNGHNLVYAYDNGFDEAQQLPKETKGNARMINLKKGTLTVKNGQPATGGQVLNNTEGRINFSTGYYALQKDGKTYKLTADQEIVVFSVTGSADPAAENYSVLNIEPEVKVISTTGKVGIIINSVVGGTTSSTAVPYASYQYVKDAKATTFTTKTLKYGCSFGVVVNMKGYTYGNKYGIQISGNNSAAPKLGLQYDYENMPKGVDFATAKAKAQYGADGYRCNWKWEGEFATSGDSCATLKDANFPEVNIAKTGECASLKETTSNGNGFYAGGYSVSTIEGYCHGSNGVYVKAGDITIDNAVISSENPNYTAISGKSDREGAGNALVCESNLSYPGETKVTIMGDTKLEAISGYAIEDKVTTAVQSTTDVIEIQGGTFKGGAEKGGIIVNNQTEIKIENGNFNDTTVNKYLDKSDNYTIITKDGTVVVNTVKPGEPTPPAVWPSDDIAVSGQDFLKWDDKTKSQTISDNREVGYFDLEAGEVIVDNGATLTVNRLILGSDTANIIVKVGGRLIVDGNMGIVANTVGNITIEAEENNMGQFLFNPAVTSNKHPLATINFNSKAYNKTEQVQFFGCPMVAGGMQNIESSNSTYESRFQIWRGTSWESIGSIGSVVNINYKKFDTPFAICGVMGTNPSTELLSYAMTGNLLGNTQPESAKIYKGWSESANSWTGDANPTAMINGLQGLGCDEAVYTYQQVGSDIQWNAHDLYGDPIKKVEPMQPLLFHNETGVELNNSILIYKDLVWDFKDAPKSAPVRHDNMTKAFIRVSAANGLSDRVVVMEADVKSMVKYPNEAIRVYANADCEYDIFAAENLENTFIGFNARNAGTYTVSFENIQGENLVLVDLVNNKQVAIVEGTEYEFEAKANEANPYRFQVRKIAEQATAVENVEAEAKADGVYTITGQFVGRKSMLNNLPAGVYVVDGKKIVK